MEKILFTNLNNKIIGLIGPNGCGKSIGIIKFAEKHNDILGNTLIIKNYNFYARNFSKSYNIYFMTPKKGLNYFIKNINLIRTIVFDELHLDKKEYYIFIKLLSFYHKIKNIRIYFVSSNLNNNFLKNHFHDLKILILNFKRFKINIEYLPITKDLNILDMQQMHFTFLFDLFCKHYEKIIKGRVIVFLASIQHCESYKLYFSNYFKNCLIFNPYISDIELSNIKYLFNDINQNFILFTTEYLEHSISIPNINLIIDFCIYFKNICNEYILSWCSKDSLNQRSGRLGRTCNGKVIRCISKELYNSLPNNKHIPYFNLEKYVLKFKMKSIDPINIFGYECVLIYDKLKKINILDYKNNIIDLNFIKFYLKSSLSIENSLLLWKLFINRNKYFKKTEYILIILSIVLIDLMKKQKISFINSKKYLNILIDKLYYFKEQDELCLLLSIFCTIFLNNDSEHISKDLNLNFKLFKIWLNKFLICLHLVYEFDLNWKKKLKNKLNIIKNNYYTLGMYKEKISKFFYNNSNFDIEIFRYDKYIYMNNKSISFYFNKWDANLSSHYLVFNKKKIKYNYYECSLFIFPYHLKFNLNHLEDGIFNFTEKLQIKNFYKHLFCFCLTEINELVSLKPFNFKMIETLNLIYESIYKWNSQLNEKLKSK